MAQTQSTAQQPRKPAARARPTVDEVLPKPEKADGDAGGTDAGQSQAEGTGGQGEAPKGLPVLPDTKTSAQGVLEEKTVLLYGPAGIGKSTLASEWAGGDMFFFDCAGELSDLEVYRGAVLDWTNFREWAASYTAEMVKPDSRFQGCVIDTADMLGTFCAAWVRGRLGIAHESDAEWGKGWTLVRETFAAAVAKLAAMPGGVILVSHSKEIEVKARNQVYDRSVPTLTGGARDACVNMADLVLFVDWDEQGENRVIYTKPDKFHEAKERGMSPRLPAAIPWPVGMSGYDVLKAAWYAESKDNTTKETAK